MVIGEYCIEMGLRLEGKSIFQGHLTKQSHYLLCLQDNSNNDQSFNECRQFLLSVTRSVTLVKFKGMQLPSLFLI